MGIATQRAMALGLLRNELLNPAALCASDPPRCPRAGAHSALVLSPITDGFEMECVWWGSMDSARSLPAVCPTEPVGLAQVWQKMGHNLSCSSALQKVGSTGRVSSTSTSLPRVPDMVTMAALPRPAWAQEHLWACHCGDHGSCSQVSLGSGTPLGWSLGACRTRVVPWTKLVSAVPYFREVWREWSLGFSNPWSFTSGTCLAGCCKKKGSCFSTWAGQLISLQENKLTHLFASEGHPAD